MMRRALKSILSIVLICLMLNPLALGASDCWRFMSNDHDTLLIGEIIQITAEDESVELTIQATSFIVSETSFVGDERRFARRQLQPEIARVVNIRPDRFYVGDYVLASLNRDGNRFRVAWGLFHVDSLDYQTLTINPENRPELWERHTAFVNSGGGYGGEVIFATDARTLGQAFLHWINEHSFYIFTLLAIILIPLVAIWLGKKLLHKTNRDA